MNFLARWQQPQTTGFIERRIEARHQSIDGTLAFLSFSKMVGGQILDLSENGLSFRYVASEQKVRGQCLVDIIVRDKTSHCQRLPCETIWDRAEPEKFSLGPFTMRSCGIRFGELTNDQELALKDFIKCHTTADCPYQAA